MSSIDDSIAPSPKSGMDEYLSFLRHGWLFRYFATVFAVTLIGILSVAFIFRYQILNGFTVLDGNRYDEVIIDAIYEHWFSVFRGFARWNEVDYFYPAHGTLGYNDGFFLYGVIYSVFRLAHFDFYLSGECVNITLRLIGFFALYLAMRRVIGVNVGLAVLSAVVFTLSNNLFLQDHHPQLLSVAFVPIMAVLLDGMVVAMIAGKPTSVMTWGVAAGCFYGAWLLTAYYMAWFFALFCSFLGVASVLLTNRSRIQLAWQTVQQQRLALTINLLAAVLASVPFLVLYLPKAHETGMHPYREAQINTLSLPDLMDVGRGNLLYGRIVAIVDHAIRPTYPAWTERLTGFPPLLLLLFACGTVLLFVTPMPRLPRRAALLRAIAVATVTTWLLTFNVDGHSLWWFVYNLIPGAKAARIVARYQLFLTIPVIAIAVFYLSTCASNTIRPIFALLCVLVVAEQVNLEPLIALDRPHELARLEAVQPPPRDCEAFVASNARSEMLLDDPGTEGFFSHNVDATIIAAMIHLPTLNGASTFQPPGWNLVDPDKPDYLDRVRRYALAHGVVQLCSLDLKTMQWSHFVLASKS